MVNKKLEDALAALKKGKMVAVYDADDREGEADLIFHAKFADSKRIERLRRDAGGLICLAVSKEVAGRIGLEFFTDIIARSNLKIKDMNCFKTAYGDKPAFSIPINHKDVYTGITDNDRALTIRKFAGIIKNIKENGTDAKTEFLNNFYVPGHVFVLIGRGIEKRKGHTEMSLELARMAGLSGAMVLCEMLGKGKALAAAEAKKYCEWNGIVFLEGKDIYG